MTSQDPTAQLVQVPTGTGESRWPMALAVLAAGGLRAAVPPELRNGDTRWAFIAVVVVLLAILVIGDPGRIDRESHWLRVLTGSLIGLITAVNASAAVRLVAGIIGAAKFSTDANILLASGGAIWLSNVIVFGLWYWDLDRGGAAARARGSDHQPAFVFPEMVNAQYVAPGWYPKFIDYLHLSFTTATAFSPTDVSAIIMSFAQGLIAETSVGLNAVPVVNERWR